MALVEEIEYSELKSTGDYSNVKISIRVSLGSNDVPAQVLERARQFVKAELSKQTLEWISEAQYIDAKRIMELDASLDQTLRPSTQQVAFARLRISQYENQRKEIMF